LVEKKAYAKLKDFYINRYLRLYPIYFCVALLTFAAINYLGLVSSKASPFFQVYANAPVSADLLLILSNLFLFGQDWVMFSGVENGALVFAKDFFKSEVVLYPGLIVPQAWTLGVELAFYLIAPFVLPHRKIIYLLLALSLGLRAYLISVGLGMKDPWTYRFFPTELALFLLGALSHQYLLPIYKRVLTRRLELYSNAATYFLIIFSAVFFLIPIPEVWKSVFLFAAFILLVPLAFLFQNRHRIDNWIGNLSYPVYIGHMFIILICGFFLEKIGIENKYLISIACVVLSIGFAIGLNKWIADPFESIRNKFRGTQKSM
jgi:peptidoglycan/LPS O-acetylase OafA/YrhL